MSPARISRPVRAKLTIAVFLLAGLGVVVWQGNMRNDEQIVQEWTLEYMPAPADNPLKGFFPYRGDYAGNFPHSMEWEHFSLNQLVTGAGTYDFAPLEQALEDCALRGHQVVVRVHVDYPSKETGVPKYLINAGVEMRRYEEYGGGLSPDYDDERLLEALEAFIAEFAKRYDGDPRLGFITVGLLGFWGEWHTYPHEGWFAGEATQNRVLQSYSDHFNKTQLLVRRPAGRSPSLSMGYHDDSFAFSTLPSIDWHFVSQLRRAAVTNHWRRLPIGGELRPELQKRLWQQPIPSDVKHENFDECVQMTHCSWLLAHEIFTERLPDNEHEIASAGARSLGYEIHVSKVSVTSTNTGIHLDLAMENRGVAPFYYDWRVAVLVRNEGEELVSHEMPWKLTEIQPGKPINWSDLISGEFHGGGKELFLLVENPMPNGLPFRFANRQHETEESLRLGKISLRP